MKNFVQKGDVIEHTLTEEVSAGDPVVIGDLVGVAVNDGESGDVISVNLTGVYELPKTTGADTGFSQGATLYLTAGGNLTETSTDNTEAGKAFADAADGDATALVKLTTA